MSPTVSNPLRENQNSSDHESSHVHGTKFEEAGLRSRSAILLHYPLFFFLPAVCLEVKLNNGHKSKYIITSLLLVITKVLDSFIGLRWSHYFEASFVVVVVYTTLLEVNMKYTRVAIIPIIIVVFMAALYRRDNRKCSSNVSEGSSSGVPVAGCSSIGINGELGEDKVRGGKKKKRDSGRSSGVTAGCSRSIGTTRNNNLGLGIGEDKARGKKPQEEIQDIGSLHHDLQPQPQPQRVGGEANTPPPPPNANGGGGSNKDRVLVAITVVPYCVLCSMRMGDAENLVVSQFLLYLTSTLGVVALMVAKLPTQKVVPLALEVVLRRSILVLVLLAAHTLAAELMGEDVVLIVMPELVTALLWFSIYIGHGGGSSSSSSSRPASSIVHKATSLEAAGVIIAVIFALSLAFANKLQGAWNLFPRISAGCAISGILLWLSVFALRQWPEGTVAEPSAEFEGAVQLFSFCRNTMLLAALAFASFKKLYGFTITDHTSISNLLIRSIHVEGPGVFP